MNIYITLSKEDFDRFSQYENPNGLFYNLYTESLITLEQKEEITKVVYDMVFNNKSTNTAFDEFVQTWYKDSDYYNDYLKSEELNEIDILIEFINDMCTSYAHLFDMVSGDHENNIFRGTDGIDYVTSVWFVDDYSIDTPIINHITVE